MQLYNWQSGIRLVLSRENLNWILKVQGLKLEMVNIFFTENSTNFLQMGVLCSKIIFSDSCLVSLTKLRKQDPLKTITRLWDARVPSRVKIPFAELYSPASWWSCLSVQRTCELGPEDVRCPMSIMESMAFSPPRAVFAMRYHLSPIVKFYRIIDP